MAIALITVLMLALTSLFISAMQTTAHQRGSQSAIRIATDEIDQARGLSYAGALSGRDRTSVLAQFDAAPATVRAWLTGRSDQAYAAGVPANAGRTQCAEGVTANCAQLPTQPVTRTLGAMSFRVSYYEEWCYRTGADKTTADCVAEGAQQSGVTYNQYLRVVVAIAWTDATCPTGGCSYLSSILLNGTAEPLFYFNDKPPAKPNLSGCTPPDVAIGDALSTEDPTHPALDIVGTNGFCAFSGGVPPFTWSAASLPQGLAVTSAGQVYGTVADNATTTTTSTISVQDAFLINGTSPAFTWTVLPRLVVSPIQDRTDVQNSTVSFSASAAGGAGGPYNFTGSGLPAGISLSADGAFGGKPSKAGTYRTTVTATDASNRRTASTSFTWTVIYPPLVTVNPGNQLSTVGGTADRIALTATGGSGRFSYADPDLTLPPGLTLANNVITGTPTAAGTFPVSLTTTDATAGYSAALSFTWTVNPPPAVMPPPNTTTPPGGAVSGQAVGTAGTAPYVFSLKNAPAWLLINSATGVLHGTASNAVADYPGIVVVLTDARGAVVESVPFTWSVYQIPTLVPPGDQTTGFGEKVSLQLQYSCTATPCSFVAENKPSWLTFDTALGKFTGTAPLTQQMYAGIGVSITDARGSVASSQFSWVVGPRQTITSPGDQSWTKGQPLKNEASAGLQITADCGSVTCTFALGSGSKLPTGLTMDPSGLITGTPSAAGTWPGIVITATAGVRPPAAAAPFSWTINDPPALNQPANQGTELGKTASLSLKANPCESAPCTFTSTALPDGLSLDPDTGVIAGRTARAGSWPITANITDKTGATATRTFTWYVLSVSVPDQALSRSTSSPKKCRSNSKTTVNLATMVTGYSSAANLTFTVSGGAGWASISGSQLTITAPCSAGSSTATVSVTATGGNAPVVTATSPVFTIRVE